MDKHPDHRLPDDAPAFDRQAIEWPTGNVTTVKGGMTTRPGPFPFGQRSVPIEVPDELEPQMRALIALATDKTLTEAQKKERLAEIDPGGLLTKATVSKVEQRIGTLQVALPVRQSLVASLLRYVEWHAEGAIDFRLQKNDCSRLHKLLESGDAGKFYDGADMEFAAPGTMTYKARDAKVFVVRHDWAAAFGDELKEGDVFKLPAPQCAFEFRVNDRSLILFVQPGADFHGISTCACFEGVDGIWFTMGEKETQRISDYLITQVRAICVALEAQVATHEVTRAPSKLNAKRTANGKPPVADFHTVDLARRLRSAAARNPDPQPTGRRVRMHFRRGHWRHYEDHKTWIEWMLVGDPDLGWIDKHYRI